jgi:hypothetical protein
MTASCNDKTLARAPAFQRWTGGRVIGAIALIIGLSFAFWTIAISSGLSRFVFFLACWIMVPYLLLFLAGWRISSIAACVILASAMLAMAVFGIWAFDKVDEDAQGGILLLFVPGYQLIGSLFFGGLALIVDGIRHRHGTVA